MLHCGIDIDIDVHSHIHRYRRALHTATNAAHVPFTGVAVQ